MGLPCIDDGMGGTFCPQPPPPPPPPPPQDVSWSITIRNGDYVKTYTEKFLDGSNEITTVNDDSFFTLIVDNQVKEHFQLGAFQQTTFSYRVSSNSAHTAKLIYWDSSEGRMKEQTQTIQFGYADQSSTFIKGLSPAHLEGTRRALVIGVMSSGIRDEDLLYGFDANLRATMQKTTEYLTEMSYGKFKWEFVDVKYTAPTKPNSNDRYTDDELQYFIPNNLSSIDKLFRTRREASYQAFKLIDRQYNFYANKITNIVFVFLSAKSYENNTSFGVTDHVYYTDDISTTNNYKWAIRQGTPFISSAQHNFPGTWAHEIMHSYGFGDSYPPKNETEDPRWHWWGLMGGAYEGHLISYHKWALGWVEAQRLDGTQPHSETKIYPTYAQNSDDLGTKGKAYYLDLGNNEYVFIEYRIKDTKANALEGSDVINSREVVVYKIKSRDMLLWDPLYDSHFRDFFDFDQTYGGVVSDGLITTRDEIEGVGYVVLDGYIQKDQFLFFCPMALMI